ncbi:MAG: protein kinase, partial [Acidimicrobiia bacterium]
MVDGIGRVLGDRYRLTALIGTGASASVYLADDRKLGRQVAVKLLHPSLADDAAFLHRFREEARSAAKLNHPGLMAVYDTGEDAGGPYLVLELLGGGSLRALLDSGERLTVSQALAVGIEAAHALERAHAEGIVHRDIKPANLLFGTDGRLRIADFGLARALSESGFTDHGDRLVGTARYAAPEQARGVRVDGKADVYALGLVLSEAITGVVPLVRDGPVETLMARIETPVPVPAAVGPLAGVLERMGRPDPAERPSAAEVAAELLALVPSVPRPVPLPLAGVDLESPTGDDELTMLPDDRTGFLPPVAPDPPKARRVQRRWVLAGLAALVAVTGGGAAVWAMSRPPTFEVPNVAGMPLADAEAALQAAMDDAGDVTWRVGTAETYHRNVAEGAVISQSPAAGTDLRDGARITLTVSQGPPPVLIPDLTGRTPAEAQALLEGVNLRLGDQTL